MTAFSDWTIEFSSGIPVYRQIVNLLYFEIGNGNLRQGDRLPTIKSLAERFKINPNTVAKAYREMDLKGVIEGRRGDGSFVAALTSPMKRLTKEQKKAKLDEIFGRVLTEAKSFGINEREIWRHITERIQEDE